jgi:hypothetical protein
LEEKQEANLKMNLRLQKEKRIKERRSDLRFAKVHEIHKNSLFGTLSEDLGWPHDGPAPISSQIWIVLSQYVKNSAEELFNLNRKEKKKINLFSKHPLAS